MYRQFIIHVHVCTVQLYNNMHRELHTAYAQISRGAVNISKLMEFHHKLFQAHLPSSVQHTHVHACYVTV